jgi:hypothetical protein
VNKAKLAVGAVALTAGLYLGSAIAKPDVVAVAPANAPHAVIIDEQAVLSALKTRGQLVGMTGNIAKKVTLTDDAWYGDKTIAITAKGTFKLGVDTADLIITTKGNTVTVRFPQPKIISVDLPFDNAVIAKDVGMLRKDLTDAELQDLYGKARKGAIADIERNRQAFDKAEASVEQIIERIVTPIDGVEDVKFIELSE